MTTTCAVALCGADVPLDGDRCVVHGEPRSWNSFLKTVADRMPVTGLRGCRIDDAHFRELMRRLPRRGDSREMVDADFTGTVFESAAEFNGVTFTRHTKFDGARFESGLTIINSSIADLELQNVVVMDHFVVERLDAERLNGGTLTVDGSVDVKKLKVAHECILPSVACTGDAVIEKLHIGGTFDAPNVEARSLRIQGVFEGRASLSLAAPTADLSSCEFSARVEVLVRSGSLNFSNVKLTEKSSISGVYGSSECAIVAIAGVDASKLVLRNLDVGSCTFALAEKLDVITLDGVRFARVKNWGRSGRAIVGDEKAWRVAGGANSSAGSVASVYGALRTSLESTKDDAIASDFYYGEMEMRRAQRRSDAFSKSGGNGARSAAFLDTVLMTAYWLISGYGLRVGRALSVFILLVIGCGILIALVGYPPVKDAYVPDGIAPSGELMYRLDHPHQNSARENIPQALNLAAQSSVSLLTSTANALTPVGSWIVLLLRFAGPIILGLALLAVRNKFRR
ncbi:hypothetical protein EV580_3409 [Mycobacterium sp. BK086]|uniref:pentapeptide repeat-containing protein n=1 Tax=Mycobacterium sp. BK086 TaxID=2512165 RepID=UPI00105CA7BC|nr:pentapeptide repeat-containing protein [Mycobacterium sp. BK086]TDO11690.1 hypothetical protein EV580_3409 [Mycobacterium sp. BK086]